MTAPATRTTLNGYGSSPYSLPIQFSYKPPVPRIRHKIHKTADGGFTIHHAGNVGTGIGGDAVIAWSIPDADRADWYAMLSLYNSATHLETERAFTGYWGESMSVLCWEMDEPTVRGQLWQLSGKFLVVSVTSWGTA